uniref:Uncharacterized protein n=1 Tax=Arundo donax TaxID=35708 RepID=A0A0A9HXP5_ARUDO
MEASVVCGHIPWSRRGFRQQQEHIGSQTWHGQRV